MDWEEVVPKDKLNFIMGIIWNSFFDFYNVHNEAFILTSTMR